jgi:transposase
MRSAKKHSFSKSRIHSKQKIENWPSYNRALKNRGRLDFMIAENLGEYWYEESVDYKRRGRQKEYSDLAIEQFIKIRCLFGLRLRQTEGFINYLFELCGLKIKSPDYTTVSKRSKKLGLSMALIASDEEFDYVSMDSTGIQTYTGNEWLENKHGKQYKRRTWKKLHVVVDGQGRILANSTTEHTADDRSQMENLLKSVKTKELLGDPGYDGENIYQLLKAKGIKPTIRPPNHSKKIEFAEIKTTREEAVYYQQTKGYQAWRVKNKYGRRERVENTFFRFKKSFGSEFLSRNDKNMNQEMIIKCKLLNRMLEIGRPISMRAA